MTRNNHISTDERVVWNNHIDDNIRHVIRSQFITPNNPGANPLLNVGVNSDMSRGWRFIVGLTDLRTVAEQLNFPASRPGYNLTRITSGTETINGIINAMPDRSIFYHTVTTGSNTNNIYPPPIGVDPGDPDSDAIFGMLRIIRLNVSRVFIEFDNIVDTTDVAGELSFHFPGKYVGFYRGRWGFQKWQEIEMLDHLNANIWNHNQTYGHRWLSRGTLLQWGLVSNVAAATESNVIFPISYNSWSNIQVSMRIGSNLAAGPVAVILPTNSSFVIRHEASGTRHIQWFAIGRVTPWYQQGPQPPIGQQTW